MKNNPSVEQKHITADHFLAMISTPIEDIVNDFYISRSDDYEIIIENIVVNEKIFIPKTLTIEHEIIVETTTILGDIDFNGRIGFFKIKGKTKNIYINEPITNFTVGNKGAIGDLIIRSNIESLEINGRLEGIKVFEGSVSFFNLGEQGYCGRIMASSESSISAVIIYGTIRFISSQGHFKTCYIFGNVGDIYLDGTYNSLWFKNSNIASLTIRNLTIHNEIKIAASKFLKITIDRRISNSLVIICHESIINTLQFRNTILFSEDNYQFSNISLNKLRFENTKVIGSLFFSNISTFGKIKVAVRDQNNLLTYNEKNELITIQKGLPSRITIFNSFLGQTQFISVDFSNFQAFHFFNSKLLECFFSSVTLPHLHQFFTEQNSEIPEQQKLFFSQVKRIYLNQGDLARSTKANAIELEIYRRQLLFSIKEIDKNDLISSKNKSRLKWNNRKERFVLYLNKVTSNYSTDWLRAILVTLTSVVILYSSYLFSLGYRPGLDFDKFLEMASHSLLYLNPLRNEDSSQLLEVIQHDFNRGYLNVERRVAITPLARVIDYLSRLVVAFLVYQTVAAYRRLGKLGG